MQLPELIISYAPLFQGLLCSLVVELLAELGKFLFAHICAARIIVKGALAFDVAVLERLYPAVELA